MKWMLVPDPDGRRIGSGLATFHALRQVREAYGRRKKILVLHCGGSSIRIPHCSAFGKVFAPLPVELAPGRLSALFDENMALLGQLSEMVEEGVVVAAGDVLVALDAASVRVSPEAVTAITVAVPAARGAGHGVFIADGPHGQVRRVLQKLPPGRLRAEGATDSRGRVLVDTGIFFLPPALADDMLAEINNAKSPLREALDGAAQMDFYTDFAEALADQTPREDYLRRRQAGEEQDGAARRMREILWKRLHGRYRLQISRAEPGTFFHLGSTADYCRALQPDSEAGRVYGFQRCVNSDLRPKCRSAVVISCNRNDSTARGRIRANAVLVDCALTDRYDVGRNALAVGMGRNGGAIRLGPRLAAFTVPLVCPGDFRAPSLRNKRAWVTAVYGVDDNPKRAMADAEATFLNRPLSVWMAERKISAGDLWPADLPTSRQTLWTARLFPAQEDSASNPWTDWFQMSARQAAREREQWRSAARLSLEEICEMTDCERLAGTAKFNESSDPTADEICQRVSKILKDREDTSVEALYRNFTSAAQFLRLKTTLDHLALSVPCFLRRARIFKVAADMLSDEALARLQQQHPRPAGGLNPVSPADDKAMLQLWGSAYEELAFANVRLAIEACISAPRQQAAGRLVPGVSLRVEVPARIDLGGGWSDTPPYSLEKGGAVVNIAVTLDGQCPVKAWAKTVSQPIIRLGCLDLGVTQEIANLEDMRTYDDVEDPLALLKAATVFEGLAPKMGSGPTKAHMQRLGAGLELITECRLPKGSGMGTSSILAAAAVAALAALRGRPLTAGELFNRVLCVEQMMTTGGGWQDQVGGVVGGIKYVHTHAEAPLEPHIKKLNLPKRALDEFNERLVVYYTGRNRLAKNILRQIMGDYLSRRQPVFGTLEKIRATADQLRDAFAARSLNTVGKLMSRSWELNKALSPTTTNDRIDALFAVAEPYAAGGKLAGAGGGGFMVLLAKDPSSAARLRKILTGLAGGTEQKMHNAAVDPVGIRVHLE